MTSTSRVGLASHSRLMTIGLHIYVRLGAFVKHTWNLFLLTTWRMSLIYKRCVRAQTFRQPWKEKLPFPLWTQAYSVDASALPLNNSPTLLRLSQICRPTSPNNVSAFLAILEFTLRHFHNVQIDVAESKLRPNPFGCEFRFPFYGVGRSGRFRFRSLKMSASSVFFLSPFLWSVFDTRLVENAMTSFRSQVSRALLDEGGCLSHPT